MLQAQLLHEHVSGSFSFCPSLVRLRRNHASCRVEGVEPEQLYSALLAMRPVSYTSPRIEVDKFQYFTRSKWSGTPDKQYVRQHRNPFLWLIHGEQVLFDQSQYPDHVLGVIEVSPDQRFVAYTLKKPASEAFRLCVKDIASRQVTEIKCDVERSVAWEKGSKSLLFISRGGSVSRCFLSFSQLKSISLEGIHTRNVVLYSSKDFELVFAVGRIGTKSQVWYIKNDWAAFWRLQALTKAGALQVDHINNHIVALDQDFQLQVVHVNRPRESALLRCSKASEHIVRFDVFADFMLLYLRRGPDPYIRVVRPYSFRDIGAAEACYSFRVQDNLNFASTSFCVNYSSFVTPPQMWMVAEKTLAVSISWKSKILNFNSRLYTTERLFASSSTEGVKIPISLVRPKDRPSDLGPSVIMAYGAYGVTSEPEFSAPVALLLGHGVQFALVHVRGGGEFALRAGKNQAVQDLLDATDYLIRASVVSAGSVAVWGTSAGAALFASAIRRAPHLFKAAVLNAPFLDIIREMQSSNISAEEKLEWFDLSTAEGWAAARLYDPMQIPASADDYPDILLVAYEDDIQAPPNHAEIYAELVNSRFPGRARVISVANADHSGPTDPWRKTQVTAEILSFLLKKLLESR